MAECFTLLKVSKNVCCYHCCEFFCYVQTLFWHLCKRLWIWGNPFKTATTGQVQNSMFACQRQTKSLWNHISTSYFRQQLLMMLWDLSKSSPMEDWGGEEGLQNNFAKRWNRELGLFSMLGNKVVNSCLGGRSPDQRGDLARNWQTVQRHCKAGWVDRCEKEKGIIWQFLL